MKAFQTLFVLICAVVAQNSNLNHYGNTYSYIYARDSADIIIGGSQGLWAHYFYGYSHQYQNVMRNDIIALTSLTDGSYYTTVAWDLCDGYGLTSDQQAGTQPCGGTVVASGYVDMIYDNVCIWCYGRYYEVNLFTVLSDACIGCQAQVSFYTSRGHRLYYTFTVVQTHWTYKSTMQSDMIYTGLTGGISETTQDRGNTLRIQALGGQNWYIETTNLYYSYGTCQFAGADEAQFELHGTVGTYHSGTYRCGALITINVDELTHFTSPELTVTIGDQWHSATYVFSYYGIPFTWANRDAMEAHAIYQSLLVTPEFGVFEIGDSDNKDQLVEVTAGELVYLKVTDLSDSDQECVLDGTDVGTLDLIGMVGPYENSDRENVCGSLFWVPSNVFTSCDDYTVTCSFTIDDKIYQVYVDGVPFLHRYTGSRNSWTSVGSITFSSCATTFAIRGVDVVNGHGSCSGGGFHMVCSSTDTSSEWHNLNTADRTLWKGTTSVWDVSNTWMNPDFDDSGWSTPEYRSYYSQIGLTSGICMDGDFHFRRTVTVTNPTQSFSTFQQELEANGPDSSSDSLLSSSASSDLSINLGNGVETVTFTLTYPIPRWTSKSAMTSDSIYYSLSPTPTEGTYTLLDSDLEDLEVEAAAGDSLYLKVQDFSDSDGECILDAELSIYNQISILGYVGPYMNSDDEHVCGALFTLGSGLLVDRDAADVQIEISDGSSEQVVFTLFFQKRWADYNAMIADGFYTSLSPTPPEATASYTDASDDGFIIEGEAGETLYLETTTLTQSDHECEIFVGGERDRIQTSVTVLGYVGPYVNADGQNTCGCLFTIANDVLVDRDASNLQIAIGDDEQQGTFTIFYQERWLSISAMEAHSFYQSLSPVPTQSTGTVGSSVLDVQVDESGTTTSTLIQYYTTVKDNLEVEAVASDTLYLEIVGLSAANGLCELTQIGDFVRGVDQEYHGFNSHTLLGYVGPYANSDGQNVCGVLLTLASNVLQSSSSANLNVIIGDGSQTVTFVLQYPYTRWSDKSQMQSDAVYTALSPTPQESLANLGSSGRYSGLELQATASDTLYLEVSQLTASNGECTLTGSHFYNYEILGLVGPYQSNGENICGALITLNSDVIAVRSDEDQNVVLGDRDQTATFILTYPITRWTDKSYMDADSLYTSLDPTPTEGIVNIDSDNDVTDLEDLEVEAVGGDSIYLKIELNAALDPFGECNLVATDLDVTLTNRADAQVHILGFVGPYENSDNEDVCGALFTLGSNMLNGRGALDVPFVFGDGTQDRTFTFTYPMPRWTSKSNMQADNLYTDLSTVYEGKAEIGESDPLELLIEAMGGNSMYLIVEGLSDGEGECILDGTDAGEVYIIGYVGPFYDLDADYVCGVLFTLADTVLTSRNDQDLELDLGDGDNEVTFTLTWRIPLFADKDAMEADSIFTTSDPAPSEGLIQIGAIVDNSGCRADAFSADGTVCRIETEAGDTHYLEVENLSDSDNECELSSDGAQGRDVTTITILAYVGPYVNANGLNACGVLITLAGDTLDSPDDADLIIAVGDDEETETFTMFKQRRWTNREEMEADGIYTGLDSTPTCGVQIECNAVIGDVEDEGLIVEAEAGEHIFLEVKTLTAGDGICELSGTDFDSVTLHGLVGPYTDSDGQNRCGVLFTLDNDVLTSRDDPNLSLTLGDQDETATFTFFYQVRWANKAAMYADSIYTNYDPAPTEGIGSVDDTTDEGLIVETEAETTLYLEVTGLDDDDRLCEIAEYSWATLVGYVGPYADGTGEYRCGVLFTLDNTVLADRDASNIQVQIGDGDESASFTLFYQQRWENKVAMEADNLYIELDPAPIVSSADVNDNNDEGLQVGAQASSTLYLEVTGLSASDGQCTLIGNDIVVSVYGPEADLNGDSVTLLGYVGPYVDDNGSNVCGALFTLDSDVLTSRINWDDPDHTIVLGDSDETTAFTLTIPIPRWADTAAMEADSIYTSLDPTPISASTAWNDDPLEVRAKLQYNMYLEATGLTAADGECVLSGTNGASAYVYGYVGPFANEDGENVCGALFVLANNVLTEESDSDIEIDVGDESEAATFILEYSLSRWANPTEMKLDPLYTALDPAPEESTGDVDDGVETQASAGESLYIEVTNLDNSDSDCEMSGTDFFSIEVIGYAGPYFNMEDRVDVCGALITIDEDKLMLEDDPPLELRLGNDIQLGAVTISQLYTSVDDGGAAGENDDGQFDGGVVIIDNDEEQEDNDVEEAEDIGEDENVDDDNVDEEAGGDDVEEESDEQVQEDTDNGGEVVNDEDASVDEEEAPNNNNDEDDGGAAQEPSDQDAQSNDDGGGGDVDLSDLIGGEQPAVQGIAVTGTMIRTAAVVGIIVVAIMFLV